MDRIRNFLRFLLAYRLLCLMLDLVESATTSTTTPAPTSRGLRHGSLWLSDDETGQYRAEALCRHMNGRIVTMVNDMEIREVRAALSKHAEKLNRKAIFWVGASHNRTRRDRVGTGNKGTFWWNHPNYTDVDAQVFRTAEDRSFPCTISDPGGYVVFIGFRNFHICPAYEKEGHRYICRIAK